MNPSNRVIRVLVADDSSLARGLLRAILEDEAGIEVIAEARHGREAVEMARDLKPDIITMDLNMPVMDGMQAISEIMHQKAIPILVVSNESDAEKAYEALRLGALEVISKPDYTPEQAAEFIAKIRLLAGVPVITHLRRRWGPDSVPFVAEPPLSGQYGAAPRGYNRVLVIVSSTGGPQALACLLPKLSVNFPAPILIAQHISDGFVEGMVHWLGSLCQLPVKVAQQGEVLRPGQVYVSPSEQHLTLTANHSVALIERQMSDIYRPSCDLLLNSVARHCGADAIGLILTGMGRDGAAGMLAMYQAGGITLAQDEASSVIYGMNQEAVNRGGVLRVLPLDALADELQRVVSLPASVYREHLTRGES